MYYLNNDDLQKLPQGMPDDELRLCMIEFKRGEFNRRKRFITCFTRMATSVALHYGLYKDVDESLRHRAEDLVGVALLELSEFPIHLSNGKLKNTNIKGYLISRVHYACKRYLRDNKMLGWSKTHLKNTGQSPLVRETFHYTDGTSRDDDIRDKAYQYVENSFIRDIMECVQTEGERLVMEMYFKNFTNREIANEFGWSSQTKVKNVIDGVVNRYKATLID